MLSNTPNAIQATFDQIREIDFSATSGTYTLVGPVFSNPVRLIKVINETDGNYYISYDGHTDQDAITTGVSFIYDICSNESIQGGYLVIPANKGFYIRRRGAAPTTGAILVVVMYAK